MTSLNRITTSPSQPTSSVLTCSCGNTFAADSEFCRKCGEKRPTTFSRYMPDFNTAKSCTCGNTFMPDSDFCRKCGAKRHDANHPETATGPGHSGVHASNPSAAVPAQASGPDTLAQWLRY